MSSRRTSEPVPLNALRALVELLQGRRVVVLTGAGVSTDSGIPDYRGPLTRHKARNPMTFAQFTKSPEQQRRYWARSARGWSTIAQAQPNAIHRAIAELEAAGVVVGVITQNVDGLHQAAGSKRVVELHGALRRVICLSCGHRSSRAALQRKLARFVGDGDADAPSVAAPDGDADVEPTDDFPDVTCDRCGGSLKPDVVFFGENVPPNITSAAWELYAEAEVLLVLGSSLTVFSGFRFVHRAHKNGLPVALVTLDSTRADKIVDCRIDAPLSEVVPWLPELLIEAS